MRLLAVMPLLAWVATAQTMQTWTANSVATPITEQTESVKHRVDGKSYAITFKYNAYVAFTPATFPPGPPHYRALITVYEIRHRKQVQVGVPFTGEYTKGLCYEDKPEALIARAKGGE